MRAVRDGLVLLVALVLQSTVLHRIEIAGVRPDLLVAFVVYIAWMRGPVVGTIAGFAVGLIQDLDASVPLGLNAFAKSLVGFLVAKAGFRVHRANAGVRFGFFFIAMLVHDVIYYGVASGGDPWAGLRTRNGRILDASIDPGDPSPRPHGRPPGMCSPAGRAGGGGR